MRSRLLLLSFFVLAPLAFLQAQLPLDSLIGTRWYSNLSLQSENQLIFVAELPKEGFNFSIAFTNDSILRIVREELRTDPADTSLNNIKYLRPSAKDYSAIIKGYYTQLVDRGSKSDGIHTSNWKDTTETLNYLPGAQKEIRNIDEALRSLKTDSTFQVLDSLIIPASTLIVPNDSTAYFIQELLDQPITVMMHTWDHYSTYYTLTISSNVLSLWGVNQGRIVGQRVNYRIKKLTNETLVLEYFE